VNLFFDTSVLVKYFHPETGTAHVIELMDNASNTLWVSDLARIEFISALYRKFRTMHPGTASVATHLADAAAHHSYIFLTIGGKGQGDKVKH